MRRMIIGGLAVAVVLVTLGLGDESLAQKVPAPRGELRIVDKRTNNWAIITVYHWHLVGGPGNWGGEKPELRRLYEQVLRTVDTRKQQELFLYNPTVLYAANKAVEFVPYASTFLMLHETGVTAKHWSMRNSHQNQKR